MKVKFEKRKKTSKLIALWVVFVMLITPFMGAAGPEKGAKADETLPYVKEADVSVGGCTVDSLVTKPTSQGKNYSWRLASGYQNAKITFGSSEPEPPVVIGYSDTSQTPVNAEYGYMYKEYTDALTLDSELDNAGDLTACDKTNGLLVQSDKKYAIYAYVTNWDAADYKEDGTANALTGTKYVLVAKCEFTFVTAPDISVAEDKLRLNWVDTEDKWYEGDANSGYKLVSSEHSVQIDGRPSYTPESTDQFSVRYAFVAKDATPENNDFSATNYVKASNAYGSYDAYAALFDVTTGNEKPLKTVKVGSFTIADKDKKEITYTWNSGTANDPISGDKNAAQSVTATTTSYDKVVSAKVTYTKDSAATVLNSTFTYAETRNDDGYFVNTFTFSLPEGMDANVANVAIGAIKIELYKDGDTEHAYISSDLGAFMFDRTRPTVVWDTNNTIQPGGDWVNGDNVSVNLTAKSGDGSVESNLKTFKYKINDGSENTVTLGTVTSQQTNITIPKSTTSAGTKITLDIADAAGNTIETTDYYFKLDGTAPSITNIEVGGEVVSGTVCANGDASVYVTATDEASGFGRIEYYVNEELKATVIDSAQADVNLETILGNSADGTYTIKARVYDAVGNFSDTTFTVIYDTQSPDYTAKLYKATTNDSGSTWSAWSEVTDAELSEGVCNIDKSDGNVKYAYKLAVIEDNLENKINDAVTLTENPNSMVIAPNDTHVFTSNEYYLVVDRNNLTPTASAPKLKVVDKAGNESEIKELTKIRAIDPNIVPTVKVFLNGEEITDTTNLVNGTNARYKAQITLECPTKFSEIKAVSKVNGAATDTVLVNLSSVYAEGTFDNVKKVYVKTFDITLLADDTTDVTKLFKDIVVTVKTTGYLTDTDISDPTKYKTFTLDNVLFDRTNPTVIEMTAKDSSSATVSEQTWVTNATFTAKVNSGNAAANESNLSEAKYTIEGTATTAGGNFTITDINGVINTPVTIPESSTTAGTKVTFVVRDIAGNYLNGTSAGKTYIYFVDATEPSVENIYARENQINELLAGDPVITADLKDNLTIDRVEVTTVGTASKTTTVTYGANVDGGTKEFRRSLTSLVADADKGGACVKDGNYTVTLKVYDKAGNSNTDTVTFTVDNTIPVVNAEISAGTINSYRSPKNISYYNGNVTVDLAYTENNIDTVTVKDNGTVVTPSWNGSKATYTATSEGRHKITIVAKDKAGHISKEKSVTFTIDKTRPDVSSSVNGAVDPGRLLELMVNANVQAYITDASSTELYYQTTYTKPYDEPVVTPYSLAGASTLTFTDEGEYTVSFYAVDAANNRSDTKTVSFRIDKTIPVVSISGTGDGVSATGRTVSFSIEEAFWKDAKATVNIYRKPGDGLRETLVKTIEITPTARVTTQSESFAESGEYRFEIEARDSIGHTAKQEGTLRIDVDKPTLSVSGVDRYDVTDDKVTFYAEINDNFYSSKVVKFAGNRKDIDGKDNKIDVTINNPKSSPTTIYEEFTEDGIYDITLTVTDEAGNSVEKELHFTIDRTAPEIESFDWLNGKVLQKFEWDKDLDEIVRDLTVCETHMYLNGSEYDGSSDLEDGSYTLRITAVDEVGHETELDNISFTIDSTKPTFIVTGVEDGDIKEETYSITVSLQLDEDTLKEVTLNGDAVEIKDNQATLSVSSKGDYELYMRAVDEAGNESEQTINFTYGKEGLPWLLILGVSGGVLLTGLVIFILLKLKKR